MLTGERDYFLSLISSHEMMTFHTHECLISFEDIFISPSKHIIFSEYYCLKSAIIILLSLSILVVCEVFTVCLSLITEKCGMWFSTKFFDENIKQLN